MADPMIGAQGFSDRDLIDFVIGSYFIVDYGFVKSVNDDDTVNVVHARKPVLMDGTELEETLTKNIEVLTFSCTEFAVSFKPKKGDKVLLVALKDWVKSTADVDKAEKPEAFIHYERETMKALPLSAFDSEAKVRLEVDGGDLGLKADGEFNLESKKKGKMKFGGDFDVDAKSGTAKIDAANIELNGNAKAFVTHKELNDALQTFVTALNAHTHPVAGVLAGQGSVTSAPPADSMTIDISGAATTTVKTGG